MGDFSNANIPSFNKNFGRFGFCPEFSIISLGPKAMMVKCKRTGERPPMPEINLKTKLNTSEVEKVEPEEELITRLVADGVKGIMDEINALDNRVLRGKIKASVVREKRKGNG